MWLTNEGGHLGFTATLVVSLTFAAIPTWMACTAHAPTQNSPEDTMTAPQPPQPPVARAEDKALTIHGDTRQDPYYWMRDDERDDPEVLAYLEAENDYTQAVLKPVEGLQERLFEEIKGRIKEDDTSVPYFFNGHWYYTRYEEGKEYPIHCRRQGTMEADELILLNANVEAEGHKFYRARSLKVSDDNALMAWGEDTLGRRIYTLRFKDLSTGEALPDVIENTSGELVWAADNRHVFYVRRQEGTLRDYQVWRHTLGTDAANDALIYEEQDETYYLGLDRTKSRRYLIIHSGTTLADEVRFLPADTPLDEFKVFLPRQRGHEYSVDHAGDRFYVRTNKDALNFRLMSVTPDKTADLTAWQEIIPHSDDVFLISMEVFKDFLVVAERREAQSELRVIPWGKPDQAHTITFAEQVYHNWLGFNPELDTHTLRLGYTSLTTPSSVYDYDMADKKLDLKKRDEVLGDFNPEDYVAQRVYVTARDGARVPVSLVHRRDLDRSKPAPLYQYAYGSYGYSMTTRFSITRLSLLDRGFIYAIAHIRGGQEYGRRWYEDGKLLNKRNTFTDFIDCSKHLIEEGYTSADKLVASGGSAGGLLMGAVINMAPDLYKTIVADVPFVDVVTTMLDESIPLTTFEYDEWGNPNDKAYYDYMLSYSPYDNVTAQDYPNIMITSGLHDSQVQYWEPTKWAARLRATKTDDNLLVLHTNMDAGHGGASGRFQRYRELAREYAFILMTLGAAP